MARVIAATWVSSPGRTPVAISATGTALTRLRRSRAALPAALSHTHSDCHRYGVRKAPWKSPVRPPPVAGVDQEGVVAGKAVPLRGALLHRATQPGRGRPVVPGCPWGVRVRQLGWP